MTGQPMAPAGSSNVEDGCKPRLQGRNWSVRVRQDRLEEFPIRENRFRRIGGAANVGGASRSPVSGQTIGAFCQETSNRSASSHPEAAPDAQLGREKSSSRRSVHPRRPHQADAVAMGCASEPNSTLCSGAYANWCSLAAVDTQRPRDKIKKAQKVRNFNRFGDFSHTDRSHRRPARIEV